MGVMLGLAAAYKLVPDNDIKLRARRLILDHVSYLVANNWHIITPTGAIDATSTSTPCIFGDTFIHMIDMRLALLSVAKMVDENQETDLGALYDATKEGVSDFTWLPIWLDAMAPADTHYFKFNLHHAALLMLLFLGSDTQEEAFRIYGPALKLLRKTVGHHRNAYFNLIWGLGQPENARLNAWNAFVPYSFSLPVNLNFQQETVLLLRQWLQRREDLGGQMVQRTPDPNYLLNSLTPDLLATYNHLGTNIPMMSTFALPVHKRPGLSMDFCWQRSPFLTSLTPVPTTSPPRTQCGDRSNVARSLNMGCCDTVSPGLDYLLPFWMAAYLKIIALDSPTQATVPARITPLIAPLDDGAVRARTQVTLPASPDLPADANGERDATLSELKANFANLERTRQAMGEIAKEVKNFSLQHYAYRTLGELFGTEDMGRYRDYAQEFKDACAKHGFTFGSSKNVGPDDNLDDPNVTMLEWFGRLNATYRIPTKFNDMLSTLAEQCQPACDYILYPLSPPESFAIVTTDRLFSPQQLTKIGQLVSSIGYGLPWGSAFSTIGLTIGREIYLTLLPKESD